MLLSPDVCCGSNSSATTDTLTMAYCTITYMARILISEGSSLRNIKKRISKEWRISGLFYFLYVGQTSKVSQSVKIKMTKVHERRENDRQWQGLTFSCHGQSNAGMTFVPCIWVDVFFFFFSILYAS